jgi:hypothetical protein
MAARSPRHADEAEWFTPPRQVNQRRYEAPRAYRLDGLTYEQDGASFGYSRCAMVDLVRQRRPASCNCLRRRRSPARATPSGSDEDVRRLRGAWHDGETLIGKGPEVYALTSLALSGKHSG